MAANTKAVYTAIFGDRDQLWEPTTVESDVDYICFTDDKSLKSEVWNVCLEDAGLRDGCPILWAKWYKMFPHICLPDHEKTLWIDGRFQIIDLRRSFGMMENDLALTRHADRSCVYAEVERVKKRRCDKIERIDRAVDLNLKHDHPKKWGLWRGGVIWRKNTKAVRDFMLLWWKFIKETSVRDQLTLPLALRLSGIEFQTFSRSFPNLIAHPHNKPKR